MLTFVRSAKDIIYDRPDGYSVSEVERITAEYKGDGDGGEDADGTKKYPNVIAIMNESFCDLNNVGNGVETNIDPLEFYRSVTDNAIKGYFYSPVYGGGTAKPEFEFLTGDTMAFIPNSLIPYNVFVRDNIPNMVDVMKAAGYQGNIANHPYYPDGWKRATVYRFMGFDAFYSLEDFRSYDHLRQFVSDEGQYDKVIEQYEAAKAESDAPFFCFNVTMQNHGGYTKDYGATPMTVKAEITDDMRGEQNETETFLSLMDASDEALQYICEYFEKVDDPTVIVYFGDHQPNLPQPFYDMLTEGYDEVEKNLEMREVPYLIWANYDIPAEELNGISANYLGPLTYRAAGLPLRGYDEFLLDLMEEYPMVTQIGYFTEDGRWHAKKGNVVTPPKGSALWEYQLLQYNMLVDTGNTDREFFYPEGWEEQ
jgi:phosphoglycerol transferase MdoB-like AlkP superfamily enzyme